MDSYSQIELSLLNNGVRCIAGVDEAGKGPLAGPVTAAAVIFPLNVKIAGVNDSKKLTPVKRERLAAEIKDKALNWSIAGASVEEIDRLNILEASRLAMKRAVDLLVLKPDICLVDGYPIPGWERKNQGIIKGDACCFSIAAASILAKVHRDELMRELNEEYPVYGFDRHKGYATEFHRNAIKENGLSPAHRKTFKLKSQ